jgi:hypothetical protein
MTPLELFPLLLPHRVLKDRLRPVVIGPSGGRLLTLGDALEIGERVLDGQCGAQHDIARVGDLAVAHTVQLARRKPWRLPTLAHDDHLVGAAERGACTLDLFGLCDRRNEYPVGARLQIALAATQRAVEPFDAIGIRARDYEEIRIGARRAGGGNLLLDERLGRQPARLGVARLLGVTRLVLQDDPGDAEPLIELHRSPNALHIAIAIIGVDDARKIGRCDDLARPIDHLAQRG